MAGLPRVNTNKNYSLYSFANNSGKFNRNFAQTVRGEVQPEPNLLELLFIFIDWIRGSGEDWGWLPNERRCQVLK